MLQFKVIDPTKQSTVRHIRRGMFAYAFKASTPKGYVWLKSSMLSREMSILYGAPGADYNSIDTYFPEYIYCIGYPEKFLVFREEIGRISAISFKGLYGPDIHESYSHDGLRWNPMGSVVDSATAGIETPIKRCLKRLVHPISQIELELTLDRIGANRNLDNRLLAKKSKQARINTNVFLNAMELKRSELISKHGKNLEPMSISRRLSAAFNCEPKRDSEAASVYRTELEGKRRSRNSSIYTHRFKVYFNSLRSSAKKRNIPFLLTKQDFSNLFEQAGISLAQVGNTKDSYCLCRIDTSGPYSLDNAIFLTRHSVNAWHERTKLTLGVANLGNLSHRVRATKQA